MDEDLFKKPFKVKYFTDTGTKVWALTAVEECETPAGGGIAKSCFRKESNTLKIGRIQRIEQQKCVEACWI